MSTHQPGMFNIEEFDGHQWLGGIGQATRQDAIATAEAWASSDGRRHRVLDPAGNLIHDTQPASCTCPVHPPAKPEDLPRLLSSPIAQFLAEVHLEVTRARQLFPGNRVMTLALAEEFGEVCRAVLDEEPARVRAEAVQLAAMCVRLVLEGDASAREWRAERGLGPLGAQG